MDKDIDNYLQRTGILEEQECEECESTITNTIFVNNTITNNDHQRGYARIESPSILDDYGVEHDNHDYDDYDVPF